MRLSVSKQEYNRTLHREKMPDNPEDSTVGDPLLDCLSRVRSLRACSNMYGGIHTIVLLPVKVWSLLTRGASTWKR
jgi:hypothetical protein